jgi:hypothetical protein
MSNWTREKLAWREHYERRKGRFFGIILQYISEEKINSAQEILVSG